MRIEFTYSDGGVEKEMILDTSFSLGFLQKVQEEKLLSSTFLRAFARGDNSDPLDPDMLILPYVCHRNAGGWMDKAEFLERFPLDGPLLTRIYNLVTLGIGKEKMANYFQIKTVDKGKKAEADA